MSFESRPSLRRAGSGETNSSGSTGSFDSHPSRSLLFGEIPSSPSLTSAGCKTSSKHSPRLLYKPWTLDLLANST
jgi:hypothetical protein